MSGVVGQPELDAGVAVETDHENLHMNRRSNRSVGMLLFLLVIVIVGPLVHDYQAQQASRYALTAAMWDDHTVELTGYEDVLGVDRAVRDGRTYSDKAPLQPILAIPAYAVYRMVGGEPATLLRIEDNLGLWWVTFWMSAVPLALLAVLMYRYARRYGPTAVTATVALVLSTMLLPFGSLLFGHVLSTLFLFGSFYLISKERPTRRDAVGAGLAAGAAVATEYFAAVGVLVIVGLVVWQRRDKILWVILGGIPSVVLLAWYHNAAFGSPLTHPYQYSAFSGEVSEATGALSVFSGLHPERVFQVFFAGRGFLVASPVVVIALIGSALLLRDRTTKRRLAGWAAVLMFVGFLGIVVMWGNPWGGESPGPRYMMPMLPFLVVGLAAIWDRASLLSRAALAMGAITMGLATVTDPLGIGRGISGGLGQWVDFARSGDFVSSLFTIAVGPIGWLIHLALAATVGYWLLRGARVEPTRTD